MVLDIGKFGPPKPKLSCNLMPERDMKELVFAAIFGMLLQFTVLHVTLPLLGPSLITGSDKKKITLSRPIDFLSSPVESLYWCDC